MDEILQPNTPVKFAARNMRPKFRRLKSGDIFLVEYEVEESVWNSLRTVPENALLETVLWHHDGDPEPKTQLAPAETDPNRPYGAYWNRMFKAGFQNYPDLIEALGCAGDQIRLRLHDVFETDSLKTVGPRQFEEWAKSEQLLGLVTLSRQCEAQAAQVA